MYIGWIKLHRSFLDWHWFTEPCTAHFFNYCLLMANAIDKDWQGYHIKRGEFITSLNSLVRETGISKDKIRTIIKRLEKSGEIEKGIEKSFTRIRIVNYEYYQGKDPQKMSENCQQIVNEQHELQHELQHEKQTIK